MIPRVAASILTLVLTAGPAPAVLAEDRGPIIDVHLHATSVEQLRHAAPHPALGTPLAPSPEAVHRRIIDAMERHNIVLGLVSDTPDGIEALTSLAPERFQAAPEIQLAPDVPGGFAPDAQAVRAKLAAGEWVAVGEVLTVYDGLRPDHPGLDPFYRLAQEFDVPVAFHTGVSHPGITRQQPAFRARYGNPTTWEETLIRHPEMRVLMMHAGYPYLEDMLAVLHVYPQVYVDTGAIIWIAPREHVHEYIGTLIDAGYGARILFGSDPMRWPDAIDRAVDVVKTAPWPDDVKRDILYNNAARFLQLPQETIDRHHGR